MDEYFLQTFALAQLEDRIQMCVVAVYATVGEQPPDVQVGVVLLAVRTGLPVFSPALRPKAG